MIRKLARMLCGHEQCHHTHEIVFDFSEFIQKDEDEISGVVAVYWHDVFGTDTYVYYGAGTDREDADFIPVDHDKSWEELQKLIVDTVRYGAFNINIRTKE